MIYNILLVPYHVPHAFSIAKHTFVLPCSFAVFFVTKIIFLMQIIDYLRCKGYNDTGLVFQPESGQQNPMNKKDLLEVNFLETLALFFG